MTIYDNDLSFPFVNDTIKISEPSPQDQSICRKEDAIIKEQSSQMLSMINIMDAYRKDIMDSRNAQLTQHNNSAHIIEQLKRRINIIIMVVALILIIVFIYFNKKRLVGDK
jgi:predicted DNA-binding protein YlxM (UPF0122 family)